MKELTYGFSRVFGEDGLFGVEGDTAGEERGSDGSDSALLALVQAWIELSREDKPA